MNKNVATNAGQVARYLEKVWPHYERSGNVTDLPPFNRKAKGEGDAPIGPYALRLMWTNLEAGKILNPLLEEAKGRSDAYRGIYYADLLNDLAYDPGRVRRWRAAETRYDAQRGEAYRKMCLHLAYLIEAEHPGYTLEIDTSADDEMLDTFEQGRSRDANRVKTHNAHRRYENLAAEIEGIVKGCGCTLKEAASVLNGRRKARKKEEVSLATIYRARAFVRGEYIEGKDFSRMEGEAS